jgi:hypothetical protein
MEEMLMHGVLVIRHNEENRKPMVEKDKAQ